MTLSVTLLGPVTVHVDGRPVVLPAGRPRSLLAGLLTGQGRRISTDRLVAALWEAPPASAASNIRTYAATLRKLLGPYGRRLVHAGDGYSLEVGPDELDAIRWSRALALAGSATPAHAADLLADALALWTGTAAEGVPRLGPVGRNLDVLDETRNTAIERYAMACIDAGRPGVAVDRLRPFVADHPCREVAWHHLVLALAAAGDRAGALATYAQAHRMLVDEAGVEPGRKLRDLQQSLLQVGERSTREPSVAGPGACMLPKDTELIGRDDLLDGIVDELADPLRPVVVALHGAAGVGKSVLAVRAAWRLAARYPDGQLYLDLAGSTPGLAPVSLAEALGGLLRALGVAPTAVSVTEDLALLRTALATRRVLVVLDNAMDAAQVRSLLSGLAGASVLLTSRIILSALDVRRHVGVGELTEPAALAMLARHGGAERVRSAPGDARTIVALCGHLPLALRIVGARLASRPDWALSAMVARLTDERHRLDELAYDDLAVRSGLTFTCGMLSEQPEGARAVDLFGGWGVARLPVIGSDLARVLGGCTGREARAMLDRLAGARLIEPLSDDRYRMHDLVRIYAMERGHETADPAARRDLVHRLRCYLLGTARQARDLVRVNPHRLADGFAEPEPTTVLTDRTAALAWLETERANMVTAIRRAAAEGTGDGDLFAARLAGELYPFLPMRGYYGDWLELSELALACARRLGSEHDEVTALTHLAGGRTRGRQHREAVAALRTALAIRERQGDERAVARALDHLGMALANAGELAEAKRVFHRSIVLHRRHEDARGLGVTLNNLADAHLKLGENDDALRNLDESLRLRVALGDHLGIGITTLSIGQAYVQKGQWTEALESLSEGLAGARESGNREAEWRALTVRAQTYRVIDRPDRARADLIEALALSEQLSDTIGASEVRQALRELPDAAGFSADRRS